MLNCTHERSNAMSIYRDFGKRLASIRQNSNLSQVQIAQKLGIAQSTYAGYEKGVRKIPLEAIVQLSNILNISPTLLILGDEISIISDYTISEQEIIKKYRALDERGKESVIATLEREYKNSTENEKSPSENKVG